MVMRNRDRRERRWSERRARKLTPRTWLMLGGVIVGFVAVLAFLILTTGQVGSGGRYPNVGDHWHSRYTISICGETLAALPASPGEVHTHGDGLFHVHPLRLGEAGRNSNLARYMASTGSRLTDDSLVLPSGESYTNGDECPNGEPGQLFLRVNGIAMAEIATYVPRDGDELVFGFEVP